MTNTSGLGPASDKDADQAGSPDTTLDTAATPRLAGWRVSIADLLGMPGDEDV